MLLVTCIAYCSSIVLYFVSKKVYSKYIDDIITSQNGEQLSQYWLIYEEIIPCFWGYQQVVIIIADMYAGMTHPPNSLLRNLRAKYSGLNNW